MRNPLPNCGARSVAPGFSRGYSMTPPNFRACFSGRQKTKFRGTISPGLPHGQHAMPHSYTNLLTHIIYSTKNRRPLIDSALESRLFPYFGGIVRQLGGKSYVVKGAEDHVHFLGE